MNIVHSVMLLVERARCCLAYIIFSQFTFAVVCSVTVTVTVTVCAIAICFYTTTTTATSQRAIAIHIVVFIYSISPMCSLLAAAHTEKKVLRLYHWNGVAICDFTFAIAIFTSFLLCLLHRSLSFSAALLHPRLPFHFSRMYYTILYYAVHYI